jgi:hypothetical protein
VNDHEKALIVWTTVVAASLSGVRTVTGASGNTGECTKTGPHCLDNFCSSWSFRDKNHYWSIRSTGECTRTGHHCLENYCSYWSFGNKDRQLLEHQVIQVNVHQQVLIFWTFFVAAGPSGVRTVTVLKHQVTQVNVHRQVLIFWTTFVATGLSGGRTATGASGHKGECTPTGPHCLDNF